MKVDLLDQKGKVVKQINLNKEIFEAEVDANAISQYVYIYLSNQREGNAHTKDRSEVRGGGKKPWKQKGTGRARFGSSRTPIWRGGGVAFGPTNDVNYKKKINKKFKNHALKSLLSMLVKENKIKFVETLAVDEDKPLTKQALDIKNKIAKDSKKITVVTSEKNAGIMKAFSNISNAFVNNTKDVSIYDLFVGGTIIMEENALESINSKFKTTKTVKKTNDSN